MVHVSPVLSSRPLCPQKGSHEPSTFMWLQGPQPKPRRPVSTLWGIWFGRKASPAPTLFLFFWSGSRVLGLWALAILASVGLGPLKLLFQGRLGPKSGFDGALPLARGDVWNLKHHRFSAWMFFLELSSPWTSQ